MCVYFKILLKIWKLFLGLLYENHVYHNQFFSNLFDFNDEEGRIQNQGVPKQMMMMAICRMARQKQNQSQKVPKFNIYV